MFRGTPNTKGRPKGANGKMTTEVRGMIYNVLKEGEEALVERLSSLNNRDFVKSYIELLKLIVPTPKEIITHDESEQKEITITYVNASDEIKRLEELENKLNLTEGEEV